MSQCVPSWVLDQNPATSKMTISSSSLPTSLDYEVAELTWENGQIAMHSLGPPRVANKTASPPATWDKPRANGTLESIVNQATSNSHPKPPINGGDCTSDTLNDLVPWYGQDHQHRAAVKPITSGSLTMTMDALVPCTAGTENHERGTCVGSCNPARATRAEMGVRKRNHVSLSVSESATCGGRDSRQFTLDTCEMELGGPGFTSTSMGSPGNTFSGKEYTVDDHDSVCHSKRKAGDEDGKRKAVIGKSSVSTKRSRAAAIHNQSERKRRDKINERMQTLQKMVPNSSKTDKASMLDEVIDYLRQLQTQVQMMNRMNISPMMLSLAMQPQLQQMAMMQMAGMGMGGMGMGVNVMDINAAINRTAAGVQPVVQPQATFMPVVSWDNPVDRLVPPTTSVVQDPLSAYLGTQPQPMNVDAYSRLAALYQQLQQNPVPGSKN